MDLKGSLSDRGIPELFQLIGNQRRTGKLRLNPGRSGNAVTVMFGNGQILRVDVERRSKRMLLGEMLVRTGQLSRSELAAALKIHKKSLRRLGDVLVEGGTLTGSAIQKSVDLQANEVLYQLFEWREGTYSFEETDARAEANISGLSPENVLLEGFKLLDEWPLIRARISNYRVVFRVIRSSTDQALNRGLGSLNSREALVLGLVDASRTVDGIIDMSGVGEFETCKALSSLLTRGNIKAVSLKGAVDDPRGHNSRRVLDSMGIVAWNLVLAVLASAALWWSYQSTDHVGAFAKVASAAMKDQGRHHIERTRAALELNRTMTGDYPQRLQSLVANEVLAPVMVNRLETAGVDYTSISSQFVLSAGE